MRRDDVGSESDNNTRRRRQQDSTEFTMAQTDSEIRECRVCGGRELKSECEIGGVGVRCEQEGCSRAVGGWMCAAF